MSMSRPMQLAGRRGRWSSAAGRCKQYEKKATNRWMRRLARRDPEHAPVKNRYGGWY